MSLLTLEKCCYEVTLMSSVVSKIQNKKILRNITNCVCNFVVLGMAIDMSYPMITTNQFDLQSEVIE